MNQSCSWCHELNELTGNPPEYCHHCGHRSDVPRIECDCEKCTTPGPPYDAATATGMYDHDF